jgi:hypothetical protein
VTLYRTTPSLRSFSAAHLTLAGCTLLLSPGCAWHLEVPPKGEAQPSTVTLEASPSITASASLSKLRFKALLLDENGNLFLESGERIRVRVDVVNTGSSPIQNASASLTGTPSVIEQFPARTLTIPPLQPGETKSLEFAATLPSSPQPQQVEIRVSVTEAGGAAARPQALLFIIQPAGAGADGVNQIPTQNPGFQQPYTYLVSIGVGTYRDPKTQPRRYAAMDAETVMRREEGDQALPGLRASTGRFLSSPPQKIHLGSHLESCMAQKNRLCFAVRPPNNRHARLRISRHFPTIRS